MVKLFISQPMHGKTDEEILAVRNKAIASAKKNMKEFGYEGEDVEVIESFFEDFDANAKPLHYLAASIKLLADADIAYFAKGWEEARGCKIEFECATQYGIDVICDYTED